MGRSKRHPVLLFVFVVLGYSVEAAAGPVILGGDDLPDHGSHAGGVNLEGWLYIERAVQSTLAGVTRPGNDGSVAALGSSFSVALDTDAGAAIGYAAAALGVTVNYYEGAAAINQFFSDLVGGVVNPAMIWLPGYDTIPGVLDASEGAALTANASGIATFVASGGGLMAHGADDDDTGIGLPIAYGWLSALIPGLIVLNGCENDGATLTPAGQAAFPGLSDSDISSGQCHNHFVGSLGTLSVLALDGSVPRLSFIIGGGAGTVLGGGAVVPTLSGWMLGLLGVMLAGTGFLVLHRLG